MKKIICTTLLSIFGFAIALAAATPRFLTTAPEVILAMVPPPPPDDSPAGMADIETILQVQKDRTPAQVARARQVDSHSFTTRGEHLFGPAFTKKNLPHTFSILLQTTMERRVVVVASKEQWNRVRPHNRGLGVKPCVKRPDDASYPSGHSASSALWTVLLSEALPEYKTIFTEFERETMWCRVLAGVHYPSDTHAGRLIGHIIAREMLKNPITQNAIKEMRAELLEFLKKHPGALAHAKEFAKTQ